MVFSIYFGTGFLPAGRRRDSLYEVRPQPSDHDDEEELHALKVPVVAKRFEGRLQAQTYMVFTYILALAFFRQVVDEIIFMKSVLKHRIMTMRGIARTSSSSSSKKV